jgi:1,2-dihydroxy-3-keto-5-methylthiopentene dioxygenase
MATLVPLYTAPTLTEPNQIQEFLASRGVAFEVWSMPGEALALAGLRDPSPDDKARLLALFADALRDKAETAGYRSADVVVIRPHFPQVEEALARFDRVHFHDDDEVRAIVGGEGIFGFVDDDGRQFEVRLQAGEYISLPAGMWHWFYCTASRDVTALRLFRDEPAWVPHYRPTARGSVAPPKPAA